MKFNTLVSWCLLNVIIAEEIEHETYTRVGRKLFGGYKITPKYCKATRQPPENLGGPNICMFNHECSQRHGQVVGACMDGFLFGACCQLPVGAAGELLESDLSAANTPDNNLYMKTTSIPRPLATSSTFLPSSQLTTAILSGSVLPTAEDNAVVQLGSDQKFTTIGLTRPASTPETMLVHNGLVNKIDPNDFKVSTPNPIVEDRKTTVRIDDTTSPYGTDNSPLIHISISSSPPLYPSTSGYNKPYFKPKPSKPTNSDKYVLVPTITHTTKPNKTQEIESIANILLMLNDSSTKSPYGETYSTSKRPPSTSYVFSATPTHRPGYNTKTTSRKPPSTSYVFSSTVPPRRPTYKPSGSTLTTKKKPSSSSPTKRPSTKPSKVTYTKPITTYPTTIPVKIQSSTFRPAHSTVAVSSDAFVVTKKPYTTNPPSSTINSHLSGPTFSVSSTPGQFGAYPSAAPTLIVLGPYGGSTDYPIKRPSTQSATPVPVRKPVTQLTINNHITQNIYSTSERPLVPTVLITPKPSISTTHPVANRPTTDYVITPIETETSPDEFNNFPPVRNPNLNMSASLLEDDITTPDFIEDAELDKKVESFVNKIILSLQEPFEGLKDVVYNKNKTATLNNLTTTKRPIKRTGTTTKRPNSKPSVNTNARPTTRKPTTKRPNTTLTTKQPSSSATKKTRRPTTTQPSLIELEDTTISSDYRTQCGIRPLVKTGRIVGGKGATFGEFPWQVLVRESTWLGLFTKNKCGGVLIGSRYVMTAAHCQPGFLASLVAVFGEFDISGDLEAKRPISRNVKRVIVHRQYDAATFENDLALLELEQPVQFDAHIVPICLPPDSEDFTGRMATVTGWGRLKYGGGVPSVLQEVQVPIMENHVCQEMFRTAGHSKVILESFLCAGYANGQKDSCEGDSGGPLVLQRPDGRFQLAGTVSHGIKCAAPYLPGVYMRTTYYKPWITSITGIQ